MARRPLGGSSPRARATDAGHLLEVDDLQTPFRTAAGHGPGRRRRELQPRPGQDPRHRRRVGLGQDRAVPLDHGPAAGQQRRDRPAPSSTRAATSPAPAPTRCAAIWGTEMAMVFQDPMTSLNPVMKIGNQIAESLRYHLDMPKDEARETALALLKSVGIPEAERRLDQYPHELSGGMRQRVTIAIALACGPKLLFADEPTTALDVTVQAQILNLLAAQQRERHMAMILVTHDLGVVAGRADEIAVMYAGQIVEQAPDRRCSSPTMKMPYTEALLDSIPKLDQPSHTRLAAIAGRPPDLIDPPKGCRFAPRCPYAQDKCRDEEPPLIEAETPGHLYKCWFPVGTVEPRRSTRRPPSTVGAPATPPPTVSTPDGRHRHRPPAPAGAGAAAGRGPPRRVPGRAAAARSRPCRASASTSSRARRSASSASPAAASPPPAGRSSSCPRPPAGRSASRARTSPRSRATGAARGPPPDAADLPGPDLVAEPPPRGRRHRRRAAADLGQRHATRSARPRSRRCSRSSASTPTSPARSGRTSSPAASASASRSPGPSCSTRS